MFHLDEARREAAAIPGQWHSRMWDTVPHPEPVARRTPNPVEEGGQLLQLVDDAEIETSETHQLQELNRPPGMY